jgi:hypothetical protein
MDVRYLLLLLIILLIFSSGNAQTSAPKPTPTPSPTEPRSERLTVISGNTLTALPSVEDSFQAKEDNFRIFLPRVSASYHPSKFPGPGEDMPKTGSASWKMLQAEIEIDITPMPPGMIATWSKEQISEELEDAAKSGVQNVTRGEMVYDHVVEQGDLTGREIKVRTGGTTLIARLFFTNDRLYMLAAMLTDEKDAETLVKKAFDTFEITKK